MDKTHIGVTTTRGHWTGQNTQTGPPHFLPLPRDIFQATA